MKAPTLSIVITNKNAMKWLDKCLTSLQKQTSKDFEVVFVDNQSTDGSYKYVQKKYPWVKTYLNKTDLGFAGANNEGVQKAKGEFVFLMNTDAYVDQNFVEKVLKALKDHPDCEYAQVNVKRYDKTYLPDKYLIFNMDIFGYPIGTNGKGRMFYADGAAVIMKRSLFLKLGGFDEKFFMYLEDLDLAWRSKLVGVKVFFFKDIVVYHFAGGTSATTHAEKNSYTTTSGRRFHAQKNNLRALLKNYSVINLLWALPGSIALALGEGVLYLLKGNVQGLLAMLKAIGWNIVYIDDTLRERKKVQAMRTVSDGAIIATLEKKISKWGSLMYHGVPKMDKL